MPKNAERLKRELKNRVAAADDEGVRQVYRDLLQAGRSRQEVISELIKLAAATPDAGKSTFSGADPIRSAPLQGEGETNTAEYAHLLYRAGTVLQSRTNVDSPVPGPAVVKDADNPLTNNGPNVNRRGDYVRALRRTVVHPVFLGVAAVALVSVAGLLLLQPTEQNQSAATALIATPTTEQRSTSEHLETGQQGAKEATNSSTSTGARDASASITPSPLVSPRPKYDNAAPEPGTALTGTALDQPTPVATSAAGRTDPAVASPKAKPSTGPPTSMRKVSHPNRQNSVRRSGHRSRRPVQ